MTVQYYINNQPVSRKIACSHLIKALPYKSIKSINWTLTNAKTDPESKKLLADYGVSVFTN